MRNYAIAAVMIAAFATPSFAAEKYFVVINADKKCLVTSETPDGKKLQQLSKQAFKTEAEASAAMKGMPACNK